MKIFLKSEPHDPTEIAVITFPSCGAIVGQAILAALLTRLPPSALASVRESHPEDPKLGGAGELHVTIMLKGALPEWTAEIYPR